MAYIPQNIPSYASSVKKSALLVCADGGINYSSDNTLIEDAQSDDMINMWLENGVLTTRPALSDDVFGNIDKVDLNLCTAFAESIIIHSGSHLYRLSEESIYVLMENLPDRKSVAVEFSGKLIIYCGENIYSVDKDFVAKKEFPYAPLHRTNCVWTGEGGTIVEDFVPNAYATTISISYNPTDLEAHRTNFTFPSDFDKTKPFRLFYNGELVDESRYSYDGNSTIIFEDYDKKEAESLVVEFFTTLKACKTTDEISTCTVGTSFGGGTLEGTRVFLSGNGETGKYFYSELGNGLYFVEDCYGTIGTGTEGVTCFSKQQDSLLIFTRNTVTRMNYNFSLDTGGYFSTSVISTDVGCDMPESVKLVDGKTVFANTSSGIYIVNSAGNFDTFKIVPISKNISGNYEKKGYTSLSKDALKNASACIYDRKYILLADTTAFVWDFGEGAYISSSDYIKSAEKLKWFVLALDNHKRLLASGKMLFALIKDAPRIHAFEYNSDKEVESKYVSKNTDFGMPFYKKVVEKIMCECKIKTKTELVLVVYANGKEYKKYSAEVSPNKDGYGHFKVKLPKCILNRFSFEIQSLRSSVGILNTRIDYIILKENYK